MRSTIAVLYLMEQKPANIAISALETDIFAEMMLCYYKMQNGWLFIEDGLILKINPSSFAFARRRETMALTTTFSLL